MTDQANAEAALIILKYVPEEVLLEQLTSSIEAYKQNKNNKNAEDLSISCMTLYLKLEIDNKGIENMKNQLKSSQLTDSIMTKMDGKDN